MSFAHLRGRVTNPAASRRTSSRRRRSRYPSSSTLSSTTSSASSTSRSSSASRRKAYSSSNATPYAPSSSSSPSRKVKVKSHRVLSASRRNHRYSPPSPPSSRPSSVSRRAAQADALLSARSGSSAASVGSNSSSGTASHTRLGRSDPLLKYNGALKLKRDPTMRRRRRERERERELEAEREREEELLRQQRLQRYEADARVDVLPSREERRRSRTTQSRAAEEEPLPVRKVDLDSMASWQEKKARLEKQRARQLEEQRQRLRQMKNGRVAPKQEPDVPEIVDAREHVQRSLSLLKSKSRSKRIASAGRTRSGVTTEAAAGSLSRESSRLSRRQRSTSSLHRFEAAAGRGTASLTPSDSSSEEEEEPPVDDVELGHSSPDSMRRSPASKRYAPASRYLTEDPLAGRPETPEEEQAPSSSGSRGSLYAIDKRARGEENPAVSPYHSRVQSEFDLPSMVSSSEYRGLVGLRNLGNTCFMNSCLQSLCCCPELLHYFDSNQYSKDINRRSPCGGRLARAFGELVAELRHGRGGAFAPYDVKKTVARIAPRFSGYGQQDVQEFLQFLLDGLHDDLNKIKVKPAYEEIKDHDDDSDEVRSQRWWRNYKERNSSFISDLFCGQLKSEVVCQRCQHKSTAFDPFWCLSVPIPKKHRRSSSFRNLLSKGSSKCTIDDCFRAFTKEELLTGNDQTYCSRCKKHRDSSKKLSIFRFPHVLVVHIKRFSSSNSSFFSFRRAKLTTDIEFPLRQLDLQEFSPNEHSGPGVYDLFAVANHSGSLGGGHYTAYGLVGEDSWANFNDSRCSRVSSSSIRGPAAYLLFYRRRPWKKAQRSNM